MLEAQSDTYQSQPDKPVDGTGDRGSSIDDRVADDLAKIGSQGTLSVVIAGLDGFRIVNDLLGPDEGDVLLAQFAECMSALSFSDVSASGDKFAVSLPGIGARDAVSLADQVRETAASRIRTPLGSLRVSAGVATYPEGAASAAELMFGANAAMYWAKSAGGDRVGYWTEIIGVNGDAWKRKGGVSDPVSALVAALEWKTKVESGQTSRSAWYARKVADMLGVAPPEQGLIETAGLLHDIGKLATPEEILQKPGALTEIEKGLVRQHPLTGCSVLKRVPSLAPAALIVAHHHEHYDGSGYPQGLRGEEIPMGSRIILVADAFDAMTTHRAYRSVLSLQTAVRELERCGGQQFDPRVVEAFVQIVSRQGLNALHWSQQGSGRTRRS